MTSPRIQKSLDFNLPLKRKTLGPSLTFEFEKKNKKKHYLDFPFSIQKTLGISRNLQILGSLCNVTMTTNSLVILLYLYSMNEKEL